MDTLAELEGLVRSCTDCPLHAGRTHAVPGEGPADAELLFIGEGPGAQEDRQGRPFVGPAGNFLEELLQSIGMSREQVYIANMVKCRPPNNRDPMPGEIAACRKYLDRQIELIDPLLIVTLGRFSMARFLPGQSISRVRGRLRQVDGRRIFPIMHPAAGLRRQEMRAAIEEDFGRIPGLLDVLRMQAEPAPPGVVGTASAVSASSPAAVREPEAAYEPEPGPSLWAAPAAAAPPFPASSPAGNDSRDDADAAGDADAGAGEDVRDAVNATDDGDDRDSGDVSGAGDTDAGADEDVRDAASVTDDGDDRDAGDVSGAGDTDAGGGEDDRDAGDVSGAGGGDAGGGGDDGAVAPAEPQAPAPVASPPTPAPMPEPAPGQVRMF